MKRTRRLLQLAFLLLTVAGVFLLRANAERWCPLGGVEAIYTYVNEGNMPCSLAVSNFYILAGLVVMTLLLRRAFCGYVCPIGAISEWLRGGARRLRIPALPVHPRLDVVLSLLKYPLLAVILYFTYRTGELIFRGFDPCYALIGRHGEDITFWAYIVSAAIVAISIFIVVPFCRWFCPLAVVLNPFSWVGLTRVKRDLDACLDCGKCDQSCPMAIPVSHMPSVTSARCTSCLNCVEACPTKEEGALMWGPPRALGRSWPQMALIGALAACLTAAVAAGYVWPIPSFVQQRGEAPPDTAAVELQVTGLDCRGRGSLFWYYLDRDDMYAVEGYLKLEAWPAPESAKVNIIYDAKRASEQALKEAITEPYYDATASIWRPSPFEIEGYDSLGLE
ncbi:MAG: 4Fe-4S binding protein [Phycisphaerales bacterium]|nr:MAG: 4Fe-4S binding protein [Phycisphaerales bacterium]